MTKSQRERSRAGTGQFVSRDAAREQSPGPQVEPPAWTQIQRGETPEAWITRIKQPWLQHQLDSGFTQDLVGLKRHELLGKHAFPVKSELDVTGRQDDAWLQTLTDQELDQLEQLKRSALARKPQDVVVQGDSMLSLTADNESVTSNPIESVG
jgi:hypothetical protein